MKNYEAKRDFLIVFYKACPVCGKSFYTTNDAIDLHHLYHKRRADESKNPVWIDEVFNLVPVHHTCHINKHGSIFKVSRLDLEMIYDCNNPDLEPYPEAFAKIARLWIETKKEYDYKKLHYYSYQWEAPEWFTATK